MRYVLGESCQELHNTLWGTAQQFVYCCWRVESRTLVAISIVKNGARFSFQSTRAIRSHLINAREQVRLRVHNEPVLLHRKWRICYSGKPTFLRRAFTPSGSSNPSWASKTFRNLERKSWKTVFPWS